MTHTPGPWEYVRGDLDGWIIDAEGRHLSRTYAVSGAEPTDNGPLMAAAPALLAALEAAYDELVDAGAGSPSVRALAVQTIHTARGAARGEGTGTNV